ncbi:MAG TPA: NADH-ubiquinone/plastoquinone oxidoreductase chain 6, partial [Desulfocapsa sulfexigens]|nr:NADH-ubiquinone/plastoquinone oxidoreductase chain 6 [Desulfocapsa sulfexigens]
VMLLVGSRSFILGTRGKWTIDAIREVTHTKALGTELFSSYLLPFEIVALILLVAVIGGILLAKQDKQEVVVDRQERSGPSTEEERK